MSGQVEAGCSLCVCAAVNVFTADEDGTTKVLVRVCLLTCPERNFFTMLRSTKIHDLIMIHGSPIKESMMDIKAASILANVDSKSDTVTVHSHRVFSVDKVSDGWNWVKKALNLFCERFLKGGMS